VLNDEREEGIEVYLGGNDLSHLEKLGISFEFAARCLMYTHLLFPSRSRLVSNRSNPAPVLA